MASKIVYQICYCFYWCIKNWLKLGQKIDFLVTPSYTLWVMPQDFAKWKTSLRYTFVLSFINIAYAVVRLKMLEVFPFRFSIQEMATCWGFLDSFSPKYCSTLLKFSPEIVFNKVNIVLEKSLLILHFGSNETHPKFTDLVHFGAQFTPGKPKILLKTKISANTESSLISNNVSTRTHSEVLWD